MSEYMSVKDIAAALSVSEKTARRYIRLMPHYTLRRVIRVRREDFERWMERARTEAGGDEVVMEILEAIAE